MLHKLLRLLLGCGYLGAEFPKAEPPGPPVKPFDKEGWNCWPQFRSDPSDASPYSHFPIQIMRDGWKSPAPILDANFMNPLANIYGLYWREIKSDQPK